MSARIREYLESRWQNITLFGGVFALITTALLWRINSLVPGYAETEAATYQDSTSFQTIWDNPLNAPFLILVRILLFIHPDSYLATRIVAVVLALGVLVVFARLLNNWHGTTTAVIGTLLFGLSAIFLHTARLGSPDVLMYGVFMLAACGFWLKRTNHWLALASCFLLAAVLLYVPGMVWFLGLGVIWQWKVIEAIFKKHLLTISLGVVTGLAALAPLGLALYKDHSLIRQWLALPSNWPNPWEMIQNLLGVPYHLLVRNEANPVMWLGNAPVLDVFCLVAFGLGVYLYLRRVRLARTRIFLSVLLLTLGLVTIGSSITVSVLVPFMYLVIAAGAAYLLTMWFAVFPRNPIARSIGWIIVGIVVVASLGYQTTHYFIGWPQAQATHDVFTAKDPQ